MEHTKYSGFSINKEIKKFLLKMALFGVAWQSFYLLLLKPKRIPDNFLTETLTIAVTKTINTFLNIHPAATWVASPTNQACFIQQNTKTILTVFDDCNGLNLFIIYLAFIVFLPYPARRKLWFSVGGVVAIFIGNVLRCTGLYWVYVHYRGAFEFNHHYVFTIVMYLIIFTGWLLFTKTNGRIHEAS